MFADDIVICRETMENMGGKGGATKAVRGRRISNCSKTKKKKKNMCRCVCVSEWVNDSQAEWMDDVTGSAEEDDGIF